MKKLTDYAKIKFFWITLERFPNLFRPSSRPYVSGDTFRNFSTHIFDESKNINYKKIKHNDIIFLNSDLIEIFFETIDKDIRSKYILITHNSDRNIGLNEIGYKSSNVIHWFAQNLSIKETEEISFLPIGLENLRRLKHGRRKWFNYKKIDKNKFILSSFNKYTNYNKRNRINKTFVNNDYVVINNFKNTNEYFRNLKNFKFVICPEGNGLDTHRIWESLLVNAIPVVIRNNFTKNLENNSVPCLYLNDWEELNGFSEDKLNEIYYSLLKKDIKKYVLFDWWKKIINEKSYILK